MTTDRALTVGGVRIEPLVSPMPLKAPARHGVAAKYVDARPGRAGRLLPNGSDWLAWANTGRQLESAQAERRESVRLKGDGVTGFPFMKFSVKSGDWSRRRDPHNPGEME